MYICITGLHPLGEVGPYDSIMVLFLFQYIYERNENKDKVVLGKGTYGVVYAGRDLSNHVRIAIKEIPEKDRTYEHVFQLR